MNFPMILKLENRRCVVVGGGKVGSRHARKLRDAGADVITVSSSFAEDLANVQRIEAHYTPEIVLNLKPFLVVAATQDAGINARIVADAQQANILTMRVDSPNEADLKGIMAVEVGEIQLTAASGTPLLSRYLLDKFAAQLTPEILIFAGWLKVLRPHVKHVIANQSDRAALWERIFNSPVMGHIEKGDLASARVELVRVIGAELAGVLP